jgi:hypothetical protein
MSEPYKLLRRLSPQGLLFEAVNTRTNRTVIVQLLKGVRTHQELKNRVGFAVRLQSPSSVRLLDAGIVEGAVPVGYLVREFVRGESLDHVLRHQPGGALPESEVLSIAWQLLDSLTEAHALGLAHARLSLDHVLLESIQGKRTGRAKLVGYWSATSLVATTATSGKALASAERIANDLRALALVIAESSGLAHLASEQSPDTRARYSGLERFLTRALSKSPQERFGTALAFREALREIDWECGSEDPAIAARIKNLLAYARGPQDLELAPHRHELMSTRTTAIWVLGTDPALSDPGFRAALAELSQDIQIRHIQASEHESLTAAILAGRTPLPWAVAFGGLEVLLDDPLLRLLSSSGELCRILVTGHQNLDLLQTCVCQGGLDGHISLPAASRDVTEQLSAVLKRTRRLSNHYDSIRLALRKTQDQVGEASRALAGRDHEPSVISGPKSRPDVPWRQAQG